jgi:hypothetical protein
MAGAMAYEALHEEQEKLKRGRRQAMGFERVIYKLDFGDTRWVGLEVRARGVTLDESMELHRLLDLGGDIMRRDDPVAAEDRRLYFELLTKIIVDWNRTDDDEPVPVDEKHLELEELPMLQAMTRAYLREVFEVAPPLSQPSSGGEPSEALFQLMEPASPSPGS